VIVGANYKPMTKESFGNAFRDACKKAGVSVRLTEFERSQQLERRRNAATVAPLEALFNWRGGTMAPHYNREADCVGLGRQRFTPWRTVGDSYCRVRH